jgi:hypothetical protein
VLVLNSAVGETKKPYASGQRFAFVVRSEPGWEAPLIVRLRHFLKLALRAYGLRCIEGHEIKDALDERVTSTGA